MGVSCRMFLLDPDDNLYRLPNTQFEQMLRDPSSHRVQRLAGTRMRMTDVVVVLQDRQAICVDRITFSYMSFDENGYFDPSAFDRHQRARVELALTPLDTAPGRAATIVDAASRFVAQGGRWTPSRALERRIYEVALGRVKCTRL